LTWLPEEKERKTQNEMGNEGGKSHEAEEFSTTADAVHWQIW